MNEKSRVAPTKPKNTTHAGRTADVITLVLFVFSLCLGSLLYGVLAGDSGYFPHPQVREAKNAVDALVQIFRDDSDQVAISSAVSSQTEPVVLNHAGIDDGALILVAGGRGFLESYNPDGGCIAWLMDRKGEIKHIWKYDPDLWADLEHVSTIPGVSKFFPVGVHMLEDGGLLVSFQGRHTYPFAIGMVRLDRDSNIIWKKESFAHHWFTVTPDQKIITPALRIREVPLPIGLTPGRLWGKDGKILEDLIVVMNLDGEVLEEASMMESLHDSGLIGLYQHVTGDSLDIHSGDPLHLNYIQRAGEQVAAAHDWLNADDLLVSFRNINSLAILDRMTWTVKWLSAGATLRQHNPIFMDSESILVFDNYGGNQALGGTRLAKIGIEDRRAETVFPTQDHPPTDPVLSRASGHLDLNRQGDAVLMTVTYQSRVLEVDLDDGTVLWEYSFVDPVTKEPVLLQTAKYCYDVEFDFNQTETTE